VITPSVIEIDLTGSSGNFIRDAQMRSTIAAAIADVREGRHIRLRVGTNAPPLWLADLLRADLFWQFSAADYRTLCRWEDAAEVVHA
jgi:hypothetical protein